VEELHAAKVNAARARIVRKTFLMEFPFQCYLRAKAIKAGEGIQPWRRFPRRQVAAAILVRHPRHYAGVVNTNHRQGLVRQGGASIGWLLEALVTHDFAFHFGEPKVGGPESGVELMQENR
jgi:hypothetical protein